MANHRTKHHRYEIHHDPDDRQTAESYQYATPSRLHYISSLPLSTGAEVRAKAVRSHWAVENELHWSLDVGFKEDACQVRKDNAPANLACIRRLALTQLKQETTKKLGIKGKRRRAGGDQTYMEAVLKIGSI